MSNAQSKGSKHVPDLLNKAMLLDLLEVGRKNLEEAGALQPMLFVQFSNGEGVVFPLEMPGESDEKYKMFYALGKQIRSKFGSIRNVVSIFESWTVVANEAPDAMKYPPSQHPCRRETIGLVGRNADKTRTAIVIQHFTRDEHNAPVWSEPKVMLSDSGTDGVVADGLLDALFDD